MTINEILEILTPENARFVAGQDLFLYVPKAQTDKRYGLAKYSPDDFSIDTNGVLSLLLPKSQIEDYLDEIRGGTREETVAADPAINLFNLDETDKILDEKIDQEVSDLYTTINTQVTRLDDMDSEIYGSDGREGTVLNNINLTNLHLVDVNLQEQIDDLIQDDEPSTSTTSTYSASKITQLIKDAKMEGLHFVGFIGSTVGEDYEGNPIVKNGALWHVSDSLDKPTIDEKWDADTMYICIDGEWVESEDYIPSDFDVWKNVNLPDDQINTWWYFEGSFEVLDFTVDMSLYYTKVESDARFKSIFTYGSYLSETNSVLNIDTDNLPTKGSLTSFVKGTSSLNVTNVEDAIKLLESNTDTTISALETDLNDKINIINTRARILDIDSDPFREGDYAFDLDGVYKSIEDEDNPGEYIWSLVSKDLDDLLPRVNADRNIVTGISFENDEETGYLFSSVSLINLNTENESSSPVSMPVATSTSDGIMPATAMQAITDLDVRVTALQSGVRAYFVTMSSDSPSQDALDLLYQQASGQTTTPPNLTRLIDVQRNIYFEYYSTLETHWQGAYVYRYTTASLIQLGLVKSSEQNGQIYVENSTGVMSLNGYTDIINTFNTLYGGTGRTSITLSQVPSLPTSKITSGTLDSNRLPIVPISKGGTGVSTFSANKILVSGSSDGGVLREGPAFGAANTVLVGQGASTLPAFKTRDEAGLELVSRKISVWGTPTNTEYPGAKLVKDSLDSEASTRSTADSTLQTNINNEATTRATNDNTLQTNITNEASARSSADTTLQNNIDAEASTRATNDTTLQNNITNEASARASQDTSLSNRIDNDATPHTTSALTLTVSGWSSSNTQTVTISGYNSSKLNTVVVDPASAIAWANAGINATSENSTGITFTCSIKPTVALTFRVVSEKLIT